MTMSIGTIQGRLRIHVKHGHKGIGRQKAGDLQEPGGFGGFVIRRVGSGLGGGDAWSGGVFDVDERLKELSAKGDGVERLNAVVDFKRFRTDMERAAPGSDPRQEPASEGFTQKNPCRSHAENVEAMKKQTALHLENGVEAPRIGVMAAFGCKPPVSAIARAW